MKTKDVVSSKKQQIIETAMQMFYQHGIHAVGINEILKVSGVAKKTLYHHFTSKEALIVATLNLRHSNFMRWISEKVASSDSPQHAIVNVFNGLDDWFNNRAELLGSFRGCFFINASAEYSQPGHPIFETCRQHKADITTLFLNQAKQFIDDSNKALELANILTIIKDGCITTALVQNDKSAAAKAIDTVKKLVAL
ncbi:TetR/AcrR family transcriptional regulator [Thalassotalea ganghwensis]